MAGLTVKYDDLNQLVATLDGRTASMDSRTSLIVRKAAFDVERIAKLLVPVDTGFLKNSIHTMVQTNSFHTFGGAIVAEVVAGAEYAGFVEHGTSRMAPQPYMQPALDRVSPGFLAALTAIGNPLDLR